MSVDIEVATRQGAVLVPTDAVHDADTARAVGARRSTTAARAARPCGSACAAAASARCSTGCEAGELVVACAAARRRRRRRLRARGGAQALSAPRRADVRESAGCRSSGSSPCASCARAACRRSSSSAASRSASRVIVFMSALLAGLQANFIRRVLTAQPHIQLLPPKEVARALGRGRRAPRARRGRDRPGAAAAPEVDRPVAGGRRRRSARCRR